MLEEEGWSGHLWCSSSRYTYPLTSNTLILENILYAVPVVWVYMETGILQLVPLTLFVCLLWFFQTQAKDPSLAGSIPSCGSRGSFRDTHRFPVVQCSLACSLAEGISCEGGRRRYIWSHSSCSSLEKIESVQRKQAKCEEKLSLKSPFKHLEEKTLKRKFEKFFFFFFWLAHLLVFINNVSQ